MMRTFSVLFVLMALLTLALPSLAGDGSGDPQGLGKAHGDVEARIKLGTCVISPPYEFVNEKGDYAGITAEYVRILNDKLGNKFKRIRCTDEGRMFTAVTLGDVDFIPLVERTPQLLQSMDFIFPYIHQPTVIVTRANAEFGSNLVSLVGKTVAVPARAGVRQYLNKLYGDQIGVLPISGNPVNTLESLLLGDADAALLDLAVAAHFLEWKRFRSMQIAGYTDYVAVRGMAVSKGKNELKQQLLGALSSMSPEEHAELLEKWLTYQTVPFWKDGRLIAWTLVILGLGLAVFSLVLGWNASLKATVQKRTSTLEAINAMLLRSIVSSTDQETSEICLEQIQQVMKAQVAFLALVKGEDLHLQAVSPNMTFDKLSVCIGRQVQDIWDESVQLDLQEVAGMCTELPRYLVLRGFRNGNEEMLVTGVAKDEPFSLEGRLVFNSLVPAFEQVLKLKKSELRLVEKDKQILRAQRMESLGTMAGGIAHDFNNILGAIIANGEMIELFHTVDDEGVNAKIDSILSAAYKGRDVVRQVLDFARPNNEGVKPLRLDELVVETERMLRASLPQTVEIGLELENDVVIVANPTQVSQVVMNLCMNSAQAMDDAGGHITLSLKTGDNIPADLAREFGVNSADVVLMQVQDTGEGIAPEVLNRVFEPFFTTKPPGVGTGLGLAVVEGIISSYGGAIRVASVPSEGTTFSIIFPVSKEQPVRLVQQLDENPDHGMGRILFVDDDEDLLFSYAEVLEKVGYVVQPMVSAHMALERFAEAPESYSLVLTDYNMPKMAGDEFARKIMELRSDIPVILCTGYSSRFDESKAEGLGLAALLKKPVSIRELTEAVGRFISPAE